MKKKREKLLRRDRRFDDLSDARTGEFIVRRLDAIECELSDLIPDLQTLHRYDDIAMLGCCLAVLKRMRKRYRKLADGHTWREDDD